jgi:hypothetical protein
VECVPSDIPCHSRAFNLSIGFMVVGGITHMKILGAMLRQERVLAKGYVQQLLFSVV